MASKKDLEAHVDDSTSPSMNKVAQVAPTEKLQLPDMVTERSSSYNNSERSFGHDALGINDAGSLNDKPSEMRRSEEDVPGYPMLTTSATIESIYSQPGSVIETSPESNYYAMSPLDDAILATLDDLETEALDLTLCLDTLEQTLETIYEEDGTGSRMMTSVSEAVSVATSELYDIGLLSLGQTADRSSSNIRPISGQSSPYPVIRTPTNSPAEGLSATIAMQSLPSISSLVVAELEACPLRAYRFEMETMTIGCYVKTLPPLVQHFTVVAGQSDALSCLTRGIVQSFCLEID